MLFGMLLPVSILQASSSQLSIRYCLPTDTDRSLMDAEMQFFDSNLGVHNGNVSRINHTKMPTLTG